MSVVGEHQNTANHNNTNHNNANYNDTNHNNANQDGKMPASMERQPEQYRMTTGQNSTITMEECDRATQGWAADHKEVVKKMADKYGPPSEATPSMVIWHDPAPFKCITVMRDAVTHKFPAEHPDFLQHTISYRIPSDRISELTAVDGSLYVDRTGGLLSAKCDSEAHNLLGFNIAHDIFTGKKTVQQGREAYAQIASDEKNGKSHPYLEKLQFQPVDEMSARDPDMSADMDASKSMPNPNMPDAKMYNPNMPNQNKPNSNMPVAPKDRDRK